jgi:large subunit ribosomal protein L5
MKKPIELLENFLNLDRYGEDLKYNQNLYAVTLFPNTTLHAQGRIYRAVLNFGFRNIDFNKKRALPFFFAMELLTKQKCIATLSSKNILVWKLRKGMLVGCKVTLRRKNLNDFFDSMALAIPRMEKFKIISSKKIKKNKSNFFSISILEIVFFFQLELGLGINSDVKQMEIHFLFNILTMEEKFFLLRSKQIPIEI